MGWFQDNIINPVREAPRKIVAETKRAVETVKKNDETLLAGLTLGASSAYKYGVPLIAGVGQEAIKTGVGAYQAIGPEGQALLGAGLGIPLPILPSQGQEYSNRKADFPQRPEVVTNSVPSMGSNFNFEKLLLPIGAFLGVIVLIFAMKRK